MNSAPDPKQIDSLAAANVVIGGSQTNIIDGQRIALPTLDEVAVYLARVRARYGRWADESSEDLFVETRALPMRLAPFSPQPAEQQPRAVELLTAVAHEPRVFILGEPGAGKSAALERLAWVTASNGLQQIAQGQHERVTVPVLARLADYRGEEDLMPLLRRSLNESGPWQLGDSSVRLLLWAKNLQWVLLLDGLNELDQRHRRDGRRAVRAHRADYGDHWVRISCRTADFDAEQEKHAELQLLPQAGMWTVQELTDEIRHWDAEGESDVRDYLRFHLGDARGRRLYEHLHGDERLKSMARIPLMLWMFRTTAEANTGAETNREGDAVLPGNRGELLQSFVRSERVLGRVHQDDRATAARCLEETGWAMQQAGALQIDIDTLYDALDAGRGRREAGLDTLAGHLKASGLLVEETPERYRLLHQLIQEYAAAAHLVRTGTAAAEIPRLARDEWWRECCIAALWLDKALHTPAYLLQIMGDGDVDLRVRVAAATILGEIGDPRFAGQLYAYSYGGARHEVEAIEPQTVAIPGGTATLGGEDPEASDDEKPACTVPLMAFELAVYPVTNAEFDRFIQAKGYDDPSLWTLGGRAWLQGQSTLDPETEQYYRQLYRYLAEDIEGFIADLKATQAPTEAEIDYWRRIPADFSEDEFIAAYAGQILGEQRREPFYWHDSRFNQLTQPVVGVNWYEAMAYAAWLARVTGRRWRLPTEPEWEWAARRNSRRYPWSDDWESRRCNWRGSGFNQPNPAGVYPQGVTPDGLHDLAGNVYEWTVSLYRDYPYDPADGREATDQDGIRILRGGSWYTDRTTVRCAYRCWLVPGGRNIYTGFRLARSSL
ncbi:MAG: SUMF1/EgtB/PvdO family nonheme iron enzyme [Caldilineaceae bacterium]|nr:SUMF1/EgtB/PvdO family nonheme iron enzyme [Caldilineaceae bacterium]